MAISRSSPRPCSPSIRPSSLRCSPRSAEVGSRMDTVGDVVVGSLVRDSGLPPPGAELLLCFLMGWERAYLVAHRDHAVRAFDADRAREWFARRRAGERSA